MNRRPGGARRWLAMIAIFCALVSCFACVLDEVQKKASPQGWAKSRGPVIPHDTFPTDCRLCHTGKGWNEIRADFKFDHAKETGYALLGAHAQAECLRCHNDRGPAADFAKRGCAGCHVDAHRGKLGSNCNECHGPNDWRPTGQLAAHARTRFPLVGAHIATACFACHPNAQVGNFQGADPSCYSCHAGDYASAKAPNHIADNFPKSCEQCHSPAGWKPAGFTHAGITSNCVQCHAQDYLTTTVPNHAALGLPMTCELCHQTKGWKVKVFNHTGITSNCVACHLKEYQTAKTPNHVAGGVPMTCEKCHQTVDWKPATFNHSGVTGACVTCHLPDYQSTTMPNHMATGIPTACAQCHTPAGWKPANFNHAGVTGACVLCHLPNYQATTNPNHAAAGFPTSCETCHSSTSTWNGANFNHTQFPIKSGKHKDFLCNQCHLTPNNFASFSCTNCHEHSQVPMNNQHSRVPGYVWTSSACYQCHPNGKAP